MNFIKKVFVVLPTVLLSFSCNSDMDYSISNIHNDIIVMGHGGMGFFHRYPLNSFESIINCINLGADGTEIDLQLSKDNILYAFHDRELSDATNMSGLIRDKYSYELENCFYNNQTNGEFRLARLDKVMERLIGLSALHFSFDCKLNSSDTELANDYYADFITALDVLISQYNLEKQVYIESGTTEFLVELHNRLPQINRFYYASGFEDALAYMAKDKVNGITVSGENITADEIAQLHREHVMVALFGCKSAVGNKKYIQRNPDIIQSDYVKHLIDELN